MQSAENKIVQFMSISIAGSTRKYLREAKVWIDILEQEYRTRQEQGIYLL